MPDAHEVRTESAWTTRSLLGWMAQAFSKKGMESPRLCAEIVLSHVLGVDRLKLYVDPDRPASPEELSTLRGLVGRALKDEPVQYLTGTGWFFGLPLMVDRRVLVPRPCTETLVETVLQRARTRRLAGQAGVPLRILDLCTGSGCIAIALAKNLAAAGVSVVATDLSNDALDVAKHNAARHKVEQLIEFRQGDLWAALGEEEVFDVVVSNPPYIPDDEWQAVPANVKNYEPTMALRGGVDGLALIRTILDRIDQHLVPGGLVMIEVAASRAGEALAMLSGQTSMTNAAIIKDLEGHERFVMGERR